MIKIYDTQQLLRDSVSYLSVTPWPVIADNPGPSIELIDPFLDNNLSENWSILHEYGSPNKTNKDSTGTNEQGPVIKFNRYPNPFQNMAYVDFSLKTNAIVEMNIYNLNGVLIHHLYKNNLIAGNYTISKDLSFLASGSYILEFKEGEEVITIKWLKT